MQCGSSRTISAAHNFRGTELRCVLEGYAAREIAARGASPELIEEFRECLAEGDRILAKGYLAKEDELSYGRMNTRFHNIIIRSARNELLAGLVWRIYAVPFVAPSIVAFNKVQSQEVFSILVSGHHQLHAIADAIEARQADVAAMLMRGHSSPARRSLGLTHADR